MKNILLLIRPHQWIKNLFLFAPLFFTFNFQSESFLNVTLGFIVFSLAASSIYILNDYKDILEDQAHPTKKHRSLASGAVAKQTAIGLMVVLFSIAIYGGFILSPMQR